MRSAPIYRTRLKCLYTASLIICLSSLAETKRRCIDCPDYHSHLVFADSCAGESIYTLFCTLSVWDTYLSLMQPLTTILCIQTAEVAVFRIAKVKTSSVLGCWTNPVRLLAQNVPPIGRTRRFLTSVNWGTALRACGSNSMPELAVVTFRLSVNLHD